MQQQAVIEIGSTGIRMLVVEITEDKKRNILDRSELPANIGRDVFTSGVISRETMISCLQILRRFAEQLKSWGIQPKDTIVLGTSAVRESTNRDPFVDRIKIKTGFTVRVIDGLEENRLMYIAVTECLKGATVDGQDIMQDDSVILEIAGGTTEMMLIENGRMVGAHSIRLGTVIIEQQVRSIKGGIEDARSYIEEFIRNSKSQFNAEMNLDKVKKFIAVGTDMKIAALFTGKSITPFLWQIQREDFDRFADEIQRYSVEEVIAKFKLNYSDAQTFKISLLTYKYFIQLTRASSIIVPETSLREGVIITNIANPSGELQLEFSAQVAASAAALLRKFQGDEKHAEYVRSMALRIYDSMQMELGLPTHTRLLLEIASILHDAGMFIGAKNHNLHSEYIIKNSEIFGLSRDDISIVAQIARYHKGTKLPSDDAEFKLLPRETRMTVLKLTSILRVADALDRSHRQHLADFTINFAKDSITFRVKGRNNLNLEKLAIEEKGGLFENVFGYKIVLV
ncbi:MAG: HD domain-containing protein [Treponema sp.]|nr:HD domain-containing protein [Treponema sp.]